MELLQLKYFCDAAKTENFSKTAEKFGVPASCISQAVRRLEKELSVKLFTRSANKISLNAKGREFFDKVIKGLSMIDNAVNAAQDDGTYDTYIYTNPNKYESVCTKNFIKFLTEEFKAEYEAAAAISTILS